VVWLSADDLGTDLSGQALHEKAADAAIRKGALGALVIETRLAPVDAIDTAHADERKFLVEAFWLSKVTGDADLRFLGQLEVMENDPLEQAAARLLSDAVSQFGVKAILAEKSEGEAKTQEYELVLNGVRDYAQFSKLKAGIVQALTDAAWVEERKLKRGQIVLGIRSQRSVDGVRRQLASVPADAGKIVVTGVEGERLDAEVRER
jgi:hypothetical protein